MAIAGEVNSNAYQGRVLQFAWETQSISAENNTRTIYYEIRAVGGNSSNYYHHNNTVSINGTNVYTGGQSDYIKTGSILKVGTFTINQSDTQQLKVEMHGGIYQYGDNINTIHVWSLDTIPRYANITSYSITNTGLNNITISWSADAYCDAVQYSINGGNWINSSNTSFNIEGLEPNCSYSIKIRVKRRDSQLWTESQVITGTTKDIGKILSVDSFNHGDSTVINITNPTGISLRLTMNIGNVRIQSKPITAGSNIVSFNDTELDNIYKLYGRGNTLTATFILTTAGSYTNSKTCTITLRGNQKTAYVGQNGKRRAKVYVGTSSGVKRAVVWIGNNGRKRCI